METLFDLSTIAQSEAKNALGRFVHSVNSV
jgi:hypothetical protein